MKGPHSGQGIHPATVRRHSERLLLALRRSGQASKAYLARLTNLTSACADRIVASLAGAGLIEFIGQGVDGQRGQSERRRNRNAGRSHASR